MGQYFLLLNLTNNTTAKPFDHGFGCKWGEFNPYVMMKQLDWSMNDVVVAQGDYGTCHNITEAADLLEENADEFDEKEDHEYFCIKMRIEERKAGTYASPYKTLDEMIAIEAYPNDTLIYQLAAYNGILSFEFTIEANEIITEINIIFADKYGDKHILVSTRKENFNAREDMQGTGIVELMTNKDYLFFPIISSTVLVHGVEATYMFRISNSKQPTKEELHTHFVNQLIAVANRIDIEASDRAFVYPNNLKLYYDHSIPYFSPVSLVNECSKLLYQLAVINHYWMPSTYYMLSNLQPKILSKAVLLEPKL